MSETFRLNFTGPSINTAIGRGLKAVLTTQSQGLSPLSKEYARDNIEAMGINNPTGTGYFSMNCPASTTPGPYSATFGLNCAAVNSYSFAEGEYTVTTANHQHVFGKYNTPDSTAIRITGWGTSSDNRNNIEKLSDNGDLYVKGDVYAGWDNNSPNGIKLLRNNDLTGTGALSLNRSTAEGATIGSYSVAVGSNNVASGHCSHAEGGDCVAGGGYSHAEGGGCVASGNYSHAEGLSTTAGGTCSHAEGYYSEASGNYSHAEGGSTTVGSNTYYLIASGDRSHAEGAGTQALGNNSHAEGYRTSAYAGGCHAEGFRTEAGVNITSDTPPGTTPASYAHAEGYLSKAKAPQSHAEGYSCEANGSQAHAEGNTCVASGDNSHAEGNRCSAIGNNSHAEGLNTIASGAHQHVAGKYNIPDTASVRITGWGTSSDSRSNIEKLSTGGNLSLAGSLTLGMNSENSVTISASQLQQLLNLLNNS